MARQTAGRVDLYARRDPPGEPLPTNIVPIQLNDAAPSNREIREAAGGLTNGRAAGASGMRAEDVKAWLHGIKLEEDPEVGPNNIGAGDNWRKFVLLVQDIRDHGEIPPQLLWVINWNGGDRGKAGPTVGPSRTGAFLWKRHSMQWTRNDAF
jgi:hypothetical protein